MKNLFSPHTLLFRLLVVSVVELFCLFAFSPFIKAQSEAEMMAAWENWMKPGDMHAWMAKSDGTWSGDVNTYFDPSNPEKSKATMTSRMVFNGLYQITEYKGNMMGMPFEGMGTLAYDNAKKEFINTWIDNMGSGLMILTGHYDKATKTLHLKGNQTDPMSGKDMPIRQTVEYPNDNTQIMGGVEVKSTGTQQSRHHLVLKGLVLRGGVEIKT